MSKNKIVELLIISIFLALPLGANAEIVRDIVFPVDGENSFSDTYGDLRSGGRKHLGTDIMADKMTPLISAVDGYISYLTENEPDWGYSLTIKDSDGYQYKYLHINNDTPGTDDGNGGRTYAFFPTIQRGTKVVAGQPIAYVGDSGNAENTGPHLHFEIWTPDREAINSYPSLIKALIGDVPGWNYFFGNDLELGSRSQDVLQLQKYLNANGFVVAKSGSGSSGNETTYFGQATKNALISFQKKYNINPASGYFGSLTRGLINNQDISQKEIIPGAQVGDLVKNKKFAEVFYVDEYMRLHWIINEQAAVKHFGETWNQNIKEFEDLNQFDLKFGDNLE